MADLVGGLVHGLVVDEASCDGAVLDLPLDDGAVSIDGVGIELDPQVGGADSNELRGCDWNWRF